MIGVIGGSGLASLSALEIEEQRWVETPFGEPSGPVLLGKIKGVSVAFLPRHGNPHRIAPHLINYRANLYALKLVGVTEVIAINAVGGIHSDFAPKALCIPDQIIDYTYGRAHTLYDGVHCEEVDHVDFTYPYTEKLRVALIEHAENLNLELMPQGTYGATQGPRLESAAEIKRCQRDGCDMVGMTGMPEAALARELGLDYACVAICVNWAAGLTDKEITMDDINAALGEGMASVVRLLESYIGDAS